jgi:hypothetical protein
MGIDPRSVLFVTLDSCRFDTFAESTAPNLRSVGQLHRALAPSYFTFGSHASMFVGFTPHVPQVRKAFLNPKYAKLFKMQHGPWAGLEAPAFVLEGENIVDGFRRVGYRTLGAAALAWFDPESAPARPLTRHFERFFYTGGRPALGRQLDWIEQSLDEENGAPVFLFLNVGETHVPYHHEGAPWSADWNPCVPFAATNDVGECRRRQRACLEFVDARLAPLLETFRSATTLVCADHGDCWGEDGVWEHGFPHEMTLTVPLLMRVAGVSV